MKYCSRCLYPENAKPTIIFDEEGVCSGCRYHENRKFLEIGWDERQEMLNSIFSKAKKEAKKRGNSHDCIVPVSGGKDSHYQVWLLKEKFNMNPLLVSYNHGFNAPSGNRNLRNLVERSDCDLVRYTSSKESVRKLSRLMLEKVGDLTWHYHAGIQTIPFQIAVARDIPLIVWGEHGFGELTGVVSINDFVEHTRWKRKELDMRGIEPEELLGVGGIELNDIAPFIFPSDEHIERAKIRGIYLSNFNDWDAKIHADLMSEKLGFSPVTYKRERTFNQHSKIDDHANDVHDYLKFLKFGYGRATDDASSEIRRGRLTREEGKLIVKEFDPVEPSTLPFYCDFMGISKKRFFSIIDEHRDHNAWRRKDGGEWSLRDPIWLQDDESVPVIEKVRLKMVDEAERTFSPKNQALHYNVDNPPIPTGESEMDERPDKFEWL